MTYTDVFGSETIPPAEFGYLSLTITANIDLVWPYNTDNSQTAVAKIIDLSCAAGNEISLPDATLVSTGEDFLVRNIGANDAIIKDYGGNVVATVQVGKASFFYLTDNSTTAGVYGVVAFGAGTSFVDAASLVGYGIKAIGDSLNSAHPVVGLNTPATLDSTYRAKLVTNTGGANTFSLESVVTLGDDFFVFIRNAGTGTLTLDPAGVETIDGQATMTVQPGESLILFCSGASWYTVGYGRSTVYQFSQLVKDVSAAGTFTLTATEASNKLMTFIGNPASAVTIVVPSVVSVYYLSSEISTAQDITFKTALGTGISIPQSGRFIALCDGTNVVAAQSVQASSSITLIDGSSTNPALSFASQTNTGLYKQGAQGLGIAVNGAAALTLETALAQIYPPQGYTRYSTGAAPAYQEGRVFYDAGEHTLAYYNDAANVTVNVGQEQLVRVRNNTGVSLTDGQVVYVNGALGNRPTVALAKADAVATSFATIGVVTDTILNGADGYVTVQGIVRNIDTSAFAEGAAVYLSSSTAGAFVASSPSISVVLGYCLRQHATQGMILVAVNNGVRVNPTVSGNLRFLGTAQRIFGDFSNATINSRLLFQDLTTNNQTYLGTIPNGTATTSGFTAFNNSTPTNASVGRLIATTSDVRLESGREGVGTYLPLTLYTNGAEVARVTTSGRIGIGNTAPSQALDVTGNVNVSGTLLMSSSFALRNKIINGNFDIWQRATSQTSPGYGSDDRWNNVNSGSTKTASRQTFTLGQTDVPNNPKYFSRTAVTSVAGAANLVYKEQKIESVLTSAGRTSVLSFYAKADAARNIAVEFLQVFGTGGAPSSIVTSIGVTTCALTASWAKFSIPVTFPSISGKTLGTDGNDHIIARFWFDAGSNFNSQTNSLGQQSGTFDIAQVQFEEGSVATPFEQRQVGLELSLCERFYQAVRYANGRYVSSVAGSYAIGTAILRETMRATPTVTFAGSSFGGVVTAVSVAAPLAGSISLNVTASGTGEAFVSTVVLSDAEL